MRWYSCFILPRGRPITSGTLGCTVSQSTFLPSFLCSPTEREEGDPPNNEGNSVNAQLGNYGQNKEDKTQVGSLSPSAFVGYAVKRPDSIGCVATRQNSKAGARLLVVPVRLQICLVCQHKTRCVSWVVSFPFFGTASKGM